MKDGKPVVAFDVDGVIDTHPACWITIYYRLKVCKFECIFVTGAEQPQDKLDRLSIPRDATIIVANRMLKRDAALAAGWEVDIWIDDMPGTIEPCRILADNLE